MFFEGSVQDALAASALRRQPLLVPVVAKDDQSTVQLMRDSHLEGLAIIHVVREGTDHHTQFSQVCPDAVMPRVHIFAPPARGLPPTVLKGEQQLTVAMVSRAVGIATEFTKNELNDTFKWALGRQSAVSRARASARMMEAAPSSVASRAPAAAAPARGSTAAAPAADPTVTPDPHHGLPKLDIELPNGSGHVSFQFHEKTTLKAVRKRLELGNQIQTEYFHFILCDGDTCRKIAHLDEDKHNLRELGLIGGTATLKVSSDATVKAVKHVDPMSGTAAASPPRSSSDEVATSTSSSTHPHPHHGLPNLDIELPNGAGHITLDFHEKTTLKAVRKRLELGNQLSSEYFHFILCDGDTCRKIAHLDEDKHNLRELGLIGGTATLKVSSDSAVKHAPKPATKVSFVHPYSQDLDVVEVTGEENLLVLWDKLREPSGDWMFLPSSKKRITREEAKTMTTQALFGQPKVLLLVKAGAEAGSPKVATASPSEDKDVRLKLVLPGGITTEVTFSTSQPLSAVREHIASLEGDGVARQCVLQLSFPPRRFSSEDEVKPIGSLRITNNSVIRVSIPSTGNGGESTGGGIAGGLMSRMAAYIPWTGGGAAAQPDPSRGGVRTLHRDPTAGADGDDHGKDKKKETKKYYDGNSTEYEEPPQ